MNNNIFKGTNIKVLDIETTGLEPQIDTIIELGVIEFQDGVFVQEHSRLFGGGKCSFDLVKLHGIKDSEREGLETFEQCGEKISKYLSNSILVGHNLKKFDVPFMDEKLKNSGFMLYNYKIIDTLLLSRKHKVAKLGSNSLGNLCSQYKIEYGNHRGLADSRSTWNLLLKLIEELRIDKLEDLMR